MVELHELIELLEKALTDRAGRREHLRRFEGILSMTKEVVGEDPQTDEILRDLADDLGYYEPDAEEQRQFSNFYGDERLQDLIRSTLRKLRP